MGSSCSTQKTKTSNVAQLTVLSEEDSKPSRRTRHIKRKLRLRSENSAASIHSSAQAERFGGILPHLLPHHQSSAAADGDGARNQTIAIERHSDCSSKLSSTACDRILEAIASGDAAAFSDVSSESWLADHLECQPYAELSKYGHEISEEHSRSLDVLSLSTKRYKVLSWLETVGKEERISDGHHSNQVSEDTNCHPQVKLTSSVLHSFARAQQVGGSRRRQPSYKAPPFPASAGTNSVDRQSYLDDLNRLETERYYRESILPEDANSFRSDAIEAGVVRNY